MLRVKLLMATAIIEVSAGVLLLVSPTFFLTLLFRVEPTAPETIVGARVTGASLVALGVACWLALEVPASRSASGLIAVMLLYNTAVGAILTLAATILHMQGVALWPAVALHTVMAVWCLACLRGK